MNDDISGSPFKDNQAPRIPTPRSAGYTNKKSFFQSIAQNPRLKLVRSESDRNIPPLKGEKEERGKLQGKRNYLSRTISLPFSSLQTISIVIENIRQISGLMI